MKTLIQLIEMFYKPKDALKANLHKDPTEKSNRKIYKQNNLPTQGHKFAGARLGAMTPTGAPGRVTRLRKDTTAAYKAAHPGQFGIAGNRKVITPQQAQQMVDQKVNVLKVMQDKRPKKWGISNSQKKHIEYHPNIGPKGTFFEVT